MLTSAKSKSEKRRNLLSGYVATEAFSHVTRNRTTGQVRSYATKKNVEGIKPRAGMTATSEIHQQPGISKEKIDKSEESLLREIEEQITDVSDDMVRVNVSLLISKYRSLRATQNISPTNHNNIWMKQAYSENQYYSSSSSEASNFNFGLDGEESKLPGLIRQISYLKSKIEMNSLRGNGTSSHHLETSLGLLQNHVHNVLNSSKPSSTSPDITMVGSSDDDKRNSVRLVVDDVIDSLHRSHEDGRDRFENYLYNQLHKDEEMGLLHYQLLTYRAANKKLESERRQLHLMLDHLKAQDAASSHQMEQGKPPAADERRSSLTKEQEIKTRGSSPQRLEIKGQKTASNDAAGGKNFLSERKRRNSSGMQETTTEPATTVTSELTQTYGFDGEEEWDERDKEIASLKMDLSMANHTVAQLHQELREKVVAYNCGFNNNSTQVRSSRKKIDQQLDVVQQAQAIINETEMCGRDGYVNAQNSVEITPEDTYQTDVWINVENDFNTSTETVVQTERDESSAVKLLHRHKILTNEDLYRILHRKGYIIREPDSLSASLRNLDRYPEWVKTLIRNPDVLNRILSTSETHQAPVPANDEVVVEDREQKIESMNREDKSNSFLEVGEGVVFVPPPRHEQKRENNRSGAIPREALPEVETKTDDKLRTKKVDESENEESSSKIKIGEDPTLTAMVMLEGEDVIKVKKFATETMASLCVGLDHVIENVSTFFNQAQVVLGGQTYLMSKANHILGETFEREKDQRVSRHRLGAMERQRTQKIYGEKTRESLHGVERKIAGAISDFMDACTSEIDLELNRYKSIRKLLGGQSIRRHQLALKNMYHDESPDGSEDVVTWIRNLQYRTSEERKGFWEKQKWFRTVKKLSHHAQKNIPIIERLEEMNFFKVDKVERTFDKRRLSTPGSGKGRSRSNINSEKVWTIHDRWVRNNKNDQQQQNEENLSDWDRFKQQYVCRPTVELLEGITSNHVLIQKQYEGLGWIHQAGYSRRLSLDEVHKRQMTSNEILSVHRVVAPPDNATEEPMPTNPTGYSEYWDSNNLSPLPDIASNKMETAY